MQAQAASPLMIQAQIKDEVALRLRLNLGPVLILGLGPEGRLLLGPDLT